MSSPISGFLAEALTQSGEDYTRKISAKTLIQIG